MLEFPLKLVIIQSLLVQAQKFPPGLRCLIFSTNITEPLFKSKNVKEKFFLTLEIQDLIFVCFLEKFWTLVLWMKYLSHILKKKKGKLATSLK